MIAREYIESLAIKGVREDGRAFDEYRDVQIEQGISSKTAEGSARVKIGDTEVVAGVKLEIVKPYSDNPDEGSIMINVEMSALASTLFETGPPSIDAIELSRVTDRGIRECGAIDFKKLCIKDGEKVWMIFIDIYPINADGNLFDAATLAAVAAIKDAFFPEVEGETVNYKKKSKNKLPVAKTPVSCTVWKIADKLVVDPTVHEELAADSRLTSVFTKDGKICAMQKGGEGPISVQDIEAMVSLAHKTSKKLREHFK
jgi:exosome complex component RRP42